MGYLREALEIGIDGAATPQEQGRQFERALRQAMRVHPAEWGKSRFDEVWLWGDWPQRESFGYTGTDLGIDLVAQTSKDWGNGGFVAIQAKYGLSTVQTSEVRAFLAASSNVEAFSERILVADRQISEIGESLIEKARPRCQLLRFGDIDSWVGDWREFIPDRIDDLTITFPKHELRSYQADALEAILRNFEEQDRGRLILPCGTGKSFVALRAAEQNTGIGKTVLYLVPSISLMGQTMREWSRHRTIEHQYIGICSDVTAGQDPDAKNENYAKGQFSELYMPVTTDIEKICDAFTRPVPPDKMRVVFSTYQSSIKIADALKRRELKSFRFDLAVCDEAHRTTGVEASFRSTEKSAKTFQLIHEDINIPVRKRLYMTATQRVFAENIRRRMEEQSFDGQSYSMDDRETFGPEAYRMSFGDAVAEGWLTDYRVVVIAASEEDYLRRAKNNPITLEDGKLVDADTVMRLAGCWDALATPKNQKVLADRDLGQLSEESSNRHARSAIAFASRIVDSQRAERLWPEVTSWHERTSEGSERRYLTLDVTHLDAKTPASKRGDLIDSLRHADNESECRLLTNVGVLSEGVDVPALDAIVFLQSRSSPVDVTQAVGRVMRRAEGKELGFVIIPIVVPQFHDFGSDESIEHLLSISDFRPVWDIIRALRSHDERIDHMLEARTMPIELRISTNVRPYGYEDRPASPIDETSLFEAISELNRRFGSMMLDVCGDRHMYPNWGDKAGVVSEQIRVRLEALVENYKSVQEVFEAFHESLLISVSPNISFEETVRMVAHHLVTTPVFDEMFGNSRFVDRNPITQSMANVLKVLSSIGADFDHERIPLKHAYRMMNSAFKGAENPRARLEVLRQIFDGFFRKAIPEEVKIMGIAYTPIELVDFMVKFVDRLCRSEFGCGLTAQNVHILDPFTGTGTFLAHMLECKDDSGEYIIRDGDLDRKYANEMHANELVLLAYYIAALKIEETKHRRTVENSIGLDANDIPYDAFKHIVLTDTFHMRARRGSEVSLFGELANNTRAAQDQIDASIQVIIGNPPWSTGRDDASENIGKIHYPEIAARITDTYVRALNEVKGSSVGGSAAGNLYVSAFRWATDRVLSNKEELPSIVALISPNSLTDGTSLAGMRKVLRDEFTDIYVVNLRGNAYKAGEEFKKEGDKIFGAASRNGVQLTFLLRNPNKNLNEPARLHYALVPEYLRLDEKFAWLRGIQNDISDSFNEVPVTAEHDWINLQDPEFDNLLPVCKLNDRSSRFIVDFHCRGVATSCDTYVYDFCRDRLIEKVRKLIEEFNRCAEIFESSGGSNEELKRLTGTRALAVIKWTGQLTQSLRKGIRLEFDETNIREVLYRPFTKCWLYEDYNIVSAGKSASKLFPRDDLLPTGQNATYKEGGVQSNFHWDDDPASLRNPSYRQPRRLGSNGKERENTPIPMILIQAPFNRSQRALTATNRLTDLHTVSPTRIIAPKR